MRKLSKLGVRAGLAIVASVAAIVATSVQADSTPVASYDVTILVSNQASVRAPTTDPLLKNAWGIAFPAFGDVVVANNGSGTATRYDGEGRPGREVVVIPAAAANEDGTPTGVVYNTTQSFRTGQCGFRAPSFFFASEDGVISAWDPRSGDEAVVVARTDAVYKGIAIARNESNDFLYATDFLHGEVNVWDERLRPVTTRGFQDTQLPSNFSPFNIRNIGGSLYVTFAEREDAETDETAGAGLGAVDIFDADGVLLRRLVPPGGHLNAPWGLARAPSDFGAFSGDLLVGNFGDGTINAYDTTSGDFKGQLTDSHGVVKIDGLWGLSFGNGTRDQPKTTLFFAAGPDDEENGLYGRIDVHH